MTRSALAEPNGAIEKGSSLIPSEKYLKVGGTGFNTASQQRNAAHCVLMRTWILYPAGGQMGIWGYSLWSIKGAFLQGNCHHPWSLSS